MFKKLAKLIDKTNKATLNSNETEFLPAVLEVTETPPSPLGRKMLWTMFGLIIVTIAWSLIGQVDEVAVAPGKLIPKGHVKIVQAEDKGIIKQIYVTDGQRVAQGELLMELDPTTSAADLAKIQKSVSYYSLEVDRLMAEKLDQPFIPKEYPGLEQKEIEFQQQLYESRSKQYHAKLAAAEFNVKQVKASLEGVRMARSKAIPMHEIAQQQEDRVKDLIQQDAAGLFMLLDYQSKRLQLEQSIATQDADIARFEWTVAQGQEALLTVMADYNREIDTQMLDDRKQLLVYTEELKKTQEKDRLSKIYSPIDGRVSQMAMYTVGGIVTAAQSLMMVVPDDVEMEVEAWIANKDIGFIHTGQRAEVKVETFSFQKYGTIDATVTDVNPDAVDDKDKGRVYRVTLKLDKSDVVVNDHLVPLNPGMTVTAEMKTRKKRIIEFFLDPFRQYRSEALRER